MGLGAGKSDEAPRRVILVDDDLAVAEMYRTGLESMGFSAAVAVDTAGLFRAVDGTVPDIIVLDWQLDGERGDEVLNRVRLDDRTRNVPVVMLSNFPPAAVEAIDRVFGVGVLAWFEKVKTPPGLLGQKLDEALQRPPARSRVKKALLRLGWLKA